MTHINPLFLTSEFTWRHLRALHKLRHEGETQASLKGPYFDFLFKQGFIDYKPSTTNIKVKRPGFDQEYDQHIQVVYDWAYGFLSLFELDEPNSPLTLLDIYNLEQVVDQVDVVVKGGFTQRQAGSNFFGGAKVLKQSKTLNAAYLKVTNQLDYPELNDIRDRALTVSGCPNARRILLCENEDYLLQPHVARALQTSLWFTGGNNLKPLFHSPDPNPEFYYACDWDYDGLMIFRRIWALYAARNQRITLLTPVVNAPRKHTNSPQHASKWKSDFWTNKIESRAPAAQVFSAEQRKLIEELITTDNWIEEESSKLPELLASNGLLANGQIT
ncbi:hypothetical protein GCM10028822_42730 [Hymenobacter terrigena]